jgi:anti-anti-sigma factor
MLAILVHRNGDEVTLHCRGNVVAGRALSVLRLAVKMRREGCIVLDLVQVSGVDAAGLGLLVELHHSMISCGKQFKISRVSTRVRRTMRLVNLHRVLNLPDNHAAVA